jgi:hypothetical protein
MDGLGGKMYVPGHVFLEYIILRSGDFIQGDPFFSARAAYMARMTTVWALQVKEVRRFSMGSPESVEDDSMSLKVQQATPILPTSPAARG